MPLPVGRGRRADAPGEGPQLKMPGYRFQNAVHVVQNFLVPESQHLITIRLQIFRSEIIGFPCTLVAMLSTIKLNHEPRFQAKEAGDVRTNRVLPPEFDGI